MFKSALFALGLAAAAQAIKVTSPTDDSIWQSGTSSQTVSWEAVDTDKTSFAILLINQVRRGGTAQQHLHVPTR